MWYLHYEKYEGEGKEIPHTNNLMNGFITVYTFTVKIFIEN